MNEPNTSVSSNTSKSEETGSYSYMPTDPLGQYLFFQPVLRHFDEIPFDNYPMLRVALPWLLGVAIGLMLAGLPLMGSLLLAAACWGILLFLVFFLLPAYHRKRLVERYGQLITCSYFLLGIGYSLFYSFSSVPSWSSEKQLYTVSVLEPTVDKSNYVQVPVRCESLPSRARESRCLLYLPKDSLVHTLQMGDRCCFYGRMYFPADSLAEGEFDYTTYLRSHGYSGVAWAHSGEWSKLSTRVPLTLKQRALQVREQLLDTYQKLGFQGESLAVLSALTLGDKSNLPSETREVFSVAGVGHVLALSGLHVGIIYGICLFLWSFVRRGRFTSIARCVSVVGLLWSFAFITGLSVSVIRSAVMFTCLALSHLQGRKTASLNVLAFSVLLMTLYNPYYLLDLGFQLSYISVASILCFHPYMERLWRPSHRVVEYLWGLLTVSLITQMALAPLLLRAYGHFSLYFLLGNLWAIPFTFILVAGAVLMLLCGFWAPLQGVLVIVMKGLLQLYVEGLHALVELPHAYLKITPPIAWGVLLFYLMILAGWLFFYQNRRTQFYLFVSLGLCAVSLQLFTQLHPSPSYLLFRTSERGCSILGAASGEAPCTLSTDSLGFAVFEGTHILKVKNRMWNRFTSSKSYGVDYLLLMDTYQGTLADLQSLFLIRRVILAPSPYDSEEEKESKSGNIDRLFRECRSQHLPVTLLSHGNRSAKFRLRKDDDRPLSDL